MYLFSKLIWMKHTCTCICLINIYLFQLNKTSSCLIRNVLWSELNFFQRSEEFIVGERPNSEEEFQELWEEVESIKENFSLIACPNGWEYEFPEAIHHSIVQDVG